MNHKTVSLSKSALRIFGSLHAYKERSLLLFIIYFIASEILGVVEEVADKRPEEYAKE